MVEWEEGTSGTKDNQEVESFGEEKVRDVVHMIECIYDLDRHYDMPEAPKSMEFLSTEPDKLAPEVQDLLKTNNLN